MNKLFILLLLSIIVISGCTSSTTPTGGATQTIDIVTTETTQDTTTSEPEPQTVEEPIDVPKEETKPKVKEKPKETVYSVNQDVTVDYLTYKVTKVETFTEMGTSMFKKETNGKFIKVYLSITNNAKETKQIFTPRFRIIDNQERKYDRLSDDMMYISDYLEFGKELQPGLTSSGAIVFELPKDSTDLKLIISGDWVSLTEVKISLTNIKDIGKDTTLKEKTDEIVDEAMEESEEMMEDLMNQCNAPFVCTSSCPEYMDVGQKDCPSGQLCCIQ